MSYSSLIIKPLLIKCKYKNITKKLYTTRNFLIIHNEKKDGVVKTNFPSSGLLNSVGACQSHDRPPPPSPDQLTWSDSQCFPTLLPRPVLSAVVQLPEPGACRVAVSEDDI